ncbi:MAG: ribosome silencing factor [Gammaproteobacteria bacterium]|nr:ribosome silencing factor [Gammaproteobacteria bacterium]
MTQNPNQSNRNRNRDTEAQAMTDVIMSALEEAKGIDIKILDVRKLTDITDCMVIVTGSSDRHVKTLSERVLEFMNTQNFSPIGVEGEDSKNWVLVDYVDVIVHIMRERTRKHYDLEGLWDDSLSQGESLPQETQIS